MRMLRFRLMVCRIVTTNITSNKYLDISGFGNFNESEGLFLGQWNFVYSPFFSHRFCVSGLFYMYVLSHVIKFTLS